MPASSAAASLSRNPLAPARSASYTYSSRLNVVTTSTLTGSGTPGAGQQAGRLDAVEHRHAHVHHDDVGPQPAGQVDRGTPVAALADHLEVGLGVDDRREAGADQGLVVADEHADGHVGGASRPARRGDAGPDDEGAARLPSRAELAAEQADPFPEPGQAAPAPAGDAVGEPGPSVLTSTVMSSGPWWTRTTVRLPCACLSALVRPSCTTR